MKNVPIAADWSAVSGELQAETLKLKSYDNTLLEKMGSAQGKHVLDYGSGPGVLAGVLTRLGARVKAYDVSTEIRDACAHVIGAKNVYDSATAIPKSAFDAVICNLVTCIVEDDEVARIAANIHRSLKPDGRAYVGFCNPTIFAVPESQLDYRLPAGKAYEENHEYRKVKKEGSYEIVEKHRPLEWYEKTFRNAGLSVVGLHATPEYQLKGHTINDFVIYELARH